MKINSELPICLLEDNNDINEYDFVLFHLYITNNVYKDYFKQQRTNHPDRLMILDNSAYEFYVKGEELDLQKYYETIVDLKPDFYILPDVLMDKDKTIKGVLEFQILYGEDIKFFSPKSKALAVAQGNTPIELIECLNLYKELFIKNIALPFHNEFFWKIGATVQDDMQHSLIDIYKAPLTKDHLYALGRAQFVKDHKNELDGFDYIHLLGSHCPFEKLFYGNEINSIDTGYPVKCAISGYKLGEEPRKPEVIIDEFLDKDLDENVKLLIKTNVAIFREL